MSTAPLVLCADDDADILALLTIRLERAGFRVAQAADGEQALSLARELSPDVLVLDVMMPRLSGTDVLSALRLTAVDRVLVVTADEGGVFRLTGQGHLRVPATVRHWCGLAAGDRVLLVADPPDDLLVVHPPAAVEAMVARRHGEVLGGEVA